MLRLICVISILLSLPTLVVSLKRLVKTYSALTIGLLILSASLTTTFLSATFHVEGFSDIVRMGIQMAGVDIPMILVAGGLLACSMTVNIIVFVFVRFVKSTNLWRWIISLMVIFLLCNLAIGITGSFLTGQSVDMCFFASCCASMGVTGVAWGLTYKEICVLVNIYIQGSICLLSALWLTWNAVRAYQSRRTFLDAVLMTIGIIIGAIYFIAFIWLCNHYAMPMVDAYNLCYQEIKQLANKYHTTYNNVNYAVFILLFIVAVIGNLATGALVRMRIMRS